MATRKKKPSRLGSTWQKHQSDFHTFTHPRVMGALEKALDKGDCPAALTALHNASVNVGAAAASKKGMVGKATEKEDQEFFAFTDIVRDGYKKFEFQCVVGGFAGLKPRRRK